MLLVHRAPFGCDAFEFDYGAQVSLAEDGPPFYVYLHYSHILIPANITTH